MGLCVGIVGLPNVGKSTTFNALTKASNAQSANYPFCTIEPNRAIVGVPDDRLNQLAKIVNPNRIIQSTVEFVDIAGLVKGASRGEGLGNKFLSNIRETEIILHIVRCFDDENITHVEGGANPVRDIEIIETELILADIEQVAKKIERVSKEVKSNVKNANLRLEILKELLSHLNDCKPICEFKFIEDENFIELNKELRLLSFKDVIYVANVDEEYISKDNDYVLNLKKFANLKHRKVIKICAKIEEELIGMDDAEAKELLFDMGVESSGLDKIIQLSFEKLNLISYFTAGVMEVRSWTIKKGWKAPKAASVIHNDFEKGFIRAEVISFKDYIQFNGEAKAKEAGKMRLEGKDYVVEDGDVMHFRFNV